MTYGIEVTIHHTGELEARKATLEDLAKVLRFLGARVFVDTGGNGAFVLKQLRSDGIAAEALPKNPRAQSPMKFNINDEVQVDQPKDVARKAYDAGWQACMRKVQKALEHLALTGVFPSMPGELAFPDYIVAGAPGPGGDWVKQQWARVPVSVEAFDRLNNQVTNHHAQIDALEKCAAIDATTGRCVGCGQTPEKCWRSEDCPGGRHYERAKKRDAEFRQHELMLKTMAGEPTCDGLHADGTRKDETYLERFNRIREETQKAALEAKLSKEDADELARYRAHTPNGQLRHGYRPDGSIGYDGLDKAPESDQAKQEDAALTAHCAKLERRAALAQSLNPFTNLKPSDE